MLLTLPNPKYNEINEYSQLGGIQMHDANTKNMLPIHIVLEWKILQLKKMGYCLSKSDCKSDW